MAATARPETSDALAATGVPMDDVPRRTLCEIVEAHGESVCTDAQRCEAFLRDLCGSYRREIFLLVSSQKEHIAADIQSALGSVPDDVLIARLTHKLSESLGLAEEPAQWAVGSWLTAIRGAGIGSSAGMLALSQVSRTDLPAWPESSDVPQLKLSPLPTTQVHGHTPRLDWRWLGLCGLAIGSAAVALAVITRVSFRHSGPSPKGWAIDTAILVSGLAVAALGEYGAARWL